MLLIGWGGVPRYCHVGDDVHAHRQLHRDLFRVHGTGLPVGNFALILVYRIVILVVIDSTFLVEGDGSFNAPIAQRNCLLFLLFGILVAQIGLIAQIGLNR